MTWGSGSNIFSNLLRRTLRRFLLLMQRVTVNGSLILSGRALLKEQVRQHVSSGGVQYKLHVHLVTTKPKTAMFLLTQIHSLGISIPSRGFDGAKPRGMRHCQRQEPIRTEAGRTSRQHARAGGQSVQFIYDLSCRICCEPAPECESSSGFVMHSEFS